MIESCIVQGFDLSPLEWENIMEAMVIADPNRTKYILYERQAADGHMSNARKRRWPNYPRTVVYRHNRFRRKL